MSSSQAARPLRVAMFTNTYRPLVGGVERSVESSAEALRRAGHACLVIAPSDPGVEFENDTLRLPAIQSLLGTPFAYRLPALGRLRARLREFAPDVVHVHHPFMLGETGLRCARSFGVPLVFTSHTRWERFFPRSSPWVRRLAQQLPIAFANVCGLVIAPSRSIDRLLCRRGLRTLSVVVPTGVDLVAARSGSRPRGRARWGLPDEARVVGHVGRLVPEKNLEYLTEAIGRALSNEPDGRFLLVGDGPAARGVATRLTALGVGERLVATGVLRGESLQDAYAAMDVFAFSSRTDTQGLVLVEAMAAGCGVVALDAPGPRDVVGPGAGILVPARATVDEFAAALACALDRGWSCRDAALACALSFDLDACAARLHEAYRLAIDGHHPVHGLFGLRRVARRFATERLLLGQKAALAGSLFG